MTLDVRRRRDQLCLRARVVANGVDVTRRCFKVDIRRRRVWLFLCDFAGRIVIHPDDRLGPIRYERKVKRLQVFV